MHVIHAENINDAWPKGLFLLQQEGIKKPSRNGDVTVVPSPVTTVYQKPGERVIFDSVRDANPFFHLHEALWMLAGRNDATWLDQFVKDFSSRFAEEDGIMHGAYGKRWREWFGFDHETGPIDQLDVVVDLLKKDIFDRQAVIQMWDAEADLGVPGLKDRPCNQQILLRADRGVLDITVTCRSNDAVYGCYGANAVHFSVLQEYLAARIGIPMGRYYQVSNNFHMYDWSKKNVDLASAHNNEVYGRVYPGTLPLVTDVNSFDSEVKQYIDDPLDPGVLSFKNEFLAHTAFPMFMSNAARLDKNYTLALEYAEKIEAPDWRQACIEWICRRIK